jgi:hypothetical protein
MFFFYEKEKYANGTSEEYIHKSINNRIKWYGKAL